MAGRYSGRGWLASRRLTNGTIITLSAITLTATAAMAQPHQARPKEQRANNQPEVAEEQREVGGMYNHDQNYRG
jgi:hypothetical protein